MRSQVTRFQERLGLLIAGGALLTLCAPKKRPHWGGMTLVALGGMLVPAGLAWLSGDTQRRSARRDTAFDKVAESSWESFPASDPPSWTLGC